MQYKDLIFSSFLIIVNESPLIESDFFKAFEIDTELEIVNSEINYSINITKENQFARLYMQYGNPFPRPDNVKNRKTHTVEKNPRNSDQYEPKQEFGLIDFKNSILWLSNSKRKNFIIEVLKDKLVTNDIIIKNVYSQEDFVNSIKKVEEIKFSALPNLFSSTNSLTKELSAEILGYGANIATIILKFTNQTVGDKILGKIKNLLNNKVTYKSLVF